MLTTNYGPLSSITSQTDGLFTVRIYHNRHKDGVVFEKKNLPDWNSARDEIFHWCFGPGARSTSVMNTRALGKTSKKGAK
jgi:hypothetical protein